MGYKENLEHYLKFSRKELQKLCKKNSLPANRSHSQLAKSLAKFFKKRSWNLTPIQVPFDNRPTKKSKDSAPTKKENGTGVHGRSCFADDRANILPGNNAGTSSNIVNQASVKAIDGHEILNKTLDTNTKSQNNTKCHISTENRAKLIPSFQFFVMSEKGLNLFVDLGSNPSNWIDSLKDEICIHPITEPGQSQTLPNSISSFVKTNSSLSSALSENDISPIENENEDENLGFKEGNQIQLVSSSCLTSDGKIINNNKRDLEIDCSDNNTIKVNNDGNEVCEVSGECGAGSSVSEKEDLVLLEEQSDVGPTCNPVSSAHDVRGEITPSKGKDNSVLSKLNDSPNSNSGNITNLRSLNTFDNVTVLPRRSTRLVSK